MFKQALSQKSKQKKTFILLAVLVCLSFFAGKFGKQYYLKHSTGFDTLFSSWFIKANTSASEDSLSKSQFVATPILFLLDAGPISEEILREKTRLNHCLGALHSFQEQFPILPCQVVRYHTKELPALNVFFQQGFSETKGPIPKHLVLFSFKLQPMEEEISFEIITLTEKYPDLKVSVIKLSSRERSHDHRLFQMANEGGGGFYWANEENDILRTLNYWFHSEILSQILNK
ncbi:MAG: hypothetical protein AABZ60_12200 [Planctomycetota bacterium]